MRLEMADDSLTAWSERHLALAVRGVRSPEVTGKITRHLERFTAWITSGLGHDRLSAVTVREVTAWREHLAAAGNVGRDSTAAPMAAATVNNPPGPPVGAVHLDQRARPRRAAAPR
ncbi:hypothetical protein ACIBKY_52895 [Nonomuraea sp. NPDC050394]|uniref:hypothetical protein n=1 Tax=Nonomuraea sp. NPDC050394 TaxID=3364363 RepID=UPI003797AA4F